jgi:hypothetical protein
MDMGGEGNIWEAIKEPRKRLHRLHDRTLDARNSKDGM